MAEQDTLRLAAQLVDQFSGPLREMTKSVHSFQDMLRGGTKQTIKDNKEHAKLQKDLNQQFINTGRTVTGILTPAMGALGLSVGGAGASIAELITKLKTAGGEFYKIQGAMKRTGLSSSELDAQSRMLTKITGQSIEASRAQLSSLGDVKAQLGRNYAPTMQALESTFNNIDGLITKMSKDTAAQAVDDFMEYYESHPASPDQQRKLLAAVGLNPDLANASADQIRKTLQEQRAFVAKYPDLSTEARQQLMQSFSALDDAADGFGRHMANAFGGETVKLVNNLAGAINYLTDSMIAYEKKKEEQQKNLPHQLGPSDIWDKAVGGVSDLAEKYPFLKHFSDENLSKALSHAGANIGGAGAGGPSDIWAVGAKSDLAEKYPWLKNQAIPHAGANTGGAGAGDGFQDRWEGLYHPAAFKSGGGYALLQGGDAGSETIWGELGRKVGPAFAYGIYGAVIGGANSLYHDPKQLFRGPILPNGKNAFQDLFQQIPKFGSKEFPNMERGFGDRWDGLYQPSSFTTGGSSSDAEKTLTHGVKQGTLEAFREWFAVESAEGGGSGRAGALGTVGGRRALATRLGIDNPGTSVPDTTDPKAMGSEYLIKQRAGMAKELRDNPQLKKELAALTTLEGNPGNVTESLANRMASIHHSLKSGMSGVFYGPYAQVPAALAKLERDPKRMAKIMKSIDDVFDRGRNVLKGATDQGMASDPNGRWQGGMVTGQDQVYNDWGGGLGHAGNARWRLDQQAHVNSEQRDLLTNEAKAGRTGGAQKIEGGADLRVAFENAPSGMKANLKNWGVFGDSGKVDWGHAMSPSDPGGR